MFASFADDPTCRATHDAELSSLLIPSKQGDPSISSTSSCVRAYGGFLGFTKINWSNSPSLMGISTNRV
jgi:hypothetical protein